MKYTKLLNSIIEATIENNSVIEEYFDTLEYEENEAVYEAGYSKLVVEENEMLLNYVQDLIMSPFKEWNTILDRMNRTLINDNVLLAIKEFEIEELKEEEREITDEQSC